MPVGLTVKIAALFAALEAKDLDELSPVERRKFGELLRYWAELAERVRRVEPHVGVLGALRYGRGDE